MTKVFFQATCHWFFLFEVNSLLFLKCPITLTWVICPQAWLSREYEESTLPSLRKEERGCWERGCTHGAWLCWEKGGVSEEKIGHTGIFVFQQLTLILLSGNLTLQVIVKFLFKKLNTVKSSSLSSPCLLLMLLLLLLFFVTFSGFNPCKKN